LDLLVHQQDKNPSNDRHFRAFPCVLNHKIKSLLQQAG
jgi:hypothetical protein